MKTLTSDLLFVSLCLYFFSQNPSGRIEFSFFSIITSFYCKVKSLVTVKSLQVITSMLTTRKAEKTNNQ